MLFIYKYSNHIHYKKTKINESSNNAYLNENMDAIKNTYNIILFLRLQGIAYFDDSSFPSL